MPWFRNIDDTWPVARYSYSEITAKAHRRANCILRCFVSKDVSLLMRAFIVYVRPIVEYCSVVWSPCLKQDIDSVEKVQRRFTKRLKGLKSMPYADCLRYLDIPSLELRRLHLDLIYCYRIVFGLVDLNVCDFFQLSLVSKTRGHQYKLYKTHCGGARSRFLLKKVSIFGMACLQQSTFHFYPALRALSVVLTFQNL